MALASRAGQPQADAAAAATDLLVSLRIIGMMLVGGVFYGFTTLAAGLCAHALVQTRQRRTARRLWLFLAYIAALWALGTVEAGSIAAAIVEAYVLQSASHRVDPTGMVINTAAWLAMLLGDGLMIWRFKIIWGSSRYFRYLALPPVALYLANIVIGVFTAVIFNLTGRSVWTGSEVSEQRMFTAYWMVTLSLNIYVTTFIAGRLFAYRRRFKANIGSVHAMHYTSIGSMLVESCSALVLFTMLLAVTYLTENPAQYMMCVVLVQVQIIVPLMVMLRISRGIAWDVSTISLVDNAIDRALGSLSDQELKPIDHSAV